jgi:hypothetical protein
MEGENVAVRVTEDGAVVPDVEASVRITKLYYSQPDTTGIEHIMGKVAEMGIEQQKLAGQHFEALLRLALARGAAPPEPVIVDSDDN